MKGIKMKYRIMHSEKGLFLDDYHYYVQIRNRFLFWTFWVTLTVTFHEMVYTMGFETEEDARKFIEKREGVGSNNQTPVWGWVKLKD